MRKLFYIFVVMINCIFYSKYGCANNDYLVWPPGNESGTFYLSTERNNHNNRFSRKGYLRAMVPIKLIEKNGVIASKWLRETNGGDEFKYVEFVSSTGAYGYIKKNSIKSLEELAERSNKSLLKSGYSDIAIPSHPLNEGSSTFHMDLRISAAGLAII